MRRQPDRLGVAVLLFATIAAAQTANDVPSQLRGVGITPKLNSRLPLDLVFRDESGTQTTIGSYTGKRPLILALVYFDCPRLCSMILTGLMKAVKPLPYTAGKEYDVLAVSFDPREKPQLAREKKAAYVERYGRRSDGDGWHFLTGDKLEIDRLTHAAGFSFNYDDRTGQYSHASAIIVLTPEGRISHYLYGIEYAPRDLRLALLEAAAGKIGSPTDRLLLYCFHYDPATGRFSTSILNVIRAGGLLTVLSLLGSVYLARRRRPGEVVAT